MKTANQIKKFFKQHFALNVNARTSSGKQQWQIAIIKSKFVNHKYLFESEFPFEFRKLCLQIIYPDHKSESWVESGNAGNVNKHSIAMLSNQWEEAIRLLEIK